MIKNQADPTDDLVALDRELERLESLRADVGEAIATFYSDNETEARREARIRILGEFHLDRPLDATHLPEIVSHAERTGEAWLFGSDVLAGDGVAVDGELPSEGDYDDPDDFLESGLESHTDVP